MADLAEDEKKTWVKLREPINRNCWNCARFPYRKVKEYMSEICGPCMLGNNWKNWQWDEETYIDQYGYVISNDPEPSWDEFDE